MAKADPQMTTGLPPPAPVSRVLTRRVRGPGGRSSGVLAPRRSATRRPGSLICSTGATFWIVGSSWSQGRLTARRLVLSSAGHQQFHRQRTQLAVGVQVNAALAGLGAGWASWIDAVRLPSSSAIRQANLLALPDPISRLVDAERRAPVHARGRPLRRWSTRSSSSSARCPCVARARSRTADL